MTARCNTAIEWPKKHELFGVQVTAAPLDAVCNSAIAAAKQRVSAVVSAFAVHALVEASSSKALGDKVNRFEIVTPDGQPIRWALSLVYGARLKSTVQGYEIMMQLCRQAADSDVSICLYGSSLATLSALENNLKRTFPG